MRRSFILLLCVIMAVFSLSACKKQDKQPIEQPAESEAGMRRTTLYYLSDEGYVVPVMKPIPWEEGIGKAALSYLVDSPDNTRSASAMGLNTVIPEGTEYTLRIGADGTAKLDMVGLPEQTRQAEQAMIAAITNTLSEFSAIDRVQFTLNGKLQAALPNGTDISEPIEPGRLNIQDGEVAVSGDARPMTLYFPNKTASLNIPVTRYVDTVPSFALAVSEIINGSGDERLLDCFPVGTGLLSVSIADGIASVDLTEEFRAVEKKEGLLQGARDSLYLCANEFEPVYGVDIYIEGREYSLHSAAVSAPVYINEFK